MTTSDVVMPEYGAEVRKLFLLRENSVFINHGSYGCVPREVHEAQVRLLQEMESHPDAWFRYKLEKNFTKAVMTLSEFLHTGPYDTFFLQNATKAINTVLKTYPLKPGDAYLIHDLSYPAINKATYVSSDRVEGAKTYQMDLTVPIASEEEIIEKYDKFFEEHKDVKIAVIDHISSPTPVLHPVKKLVEVCHRHDVIAVVDGAHAPGQIPLNLPDIDADFYTGNLHKWLFTPRGCGFIWMNPKRKKEWFKPLITSTYDDSGLHVQFGYEEDGAIGPKDEVCWTIITLSHSGMTADQKNGGWLMSTYKSTEHEMQIKGTKKSIVQGILPMDGRSAPRLRPWIRSAEVRGINVVMRIGTQQQGILPKTKRQEKTLPYAAELRHKAIPYLEKRWGTERLAIPEDMVAPYMQMIKLPYLKGYTDDPENSWRPLMKDLLERFDIQVAVNNVQGDLYARLSFPAYVVFDDVVKLGDAIETMHKEFIEDNDKHKESSP